MLRLLVNKRFLAASVAALIAAALTLFVASGSSTRPRSRFFYKRYDPQAARWLTWLQKRGSFTEAYDQARRGGETWTADPTQVALHLVGYPNPDRTEPDRVQVFGVVGEAVTVIILDENLADDAVSDEEDRVDLVKDGDKWKVAWWGRRWRCSREFYTGWTSSISCS
jgi:hypothetical protein